jgi:hypothetical protein
MEFIGCGGLGGWIMKEWDLGRWRVGGGVGRFIVGGMGCWGKWRVAERIWGDGDGICEIGG